MTNLTIPSGITREEYEVLRELIEESSDENTITSKKDIILNFDVNTLTFTYEDAAIGENCYCSVYFNDVDVASIAGIHVDTIDGGLKFSCQQLPTEDVVCNIVITNI